MYKVVTEKEEAETNTSYEATSAQDVKKKTTRGKSVTLQTITVQKQLLKLSFKSKSIVIFLNVYKHHSIRYINTFAYNTFCVFCTKNIHCSNHTKSPENSFHFCR